MISKTVLHHVLIAFLFCIFLAGPSRAQDAETDKADVADATAESEEATSADADDEESDVIVDDGSYLDAEDDDFKPSEEISADRSISFPTDI